MDVGNNKSLLQAMNHSHSVTKEADNQLKVQNFHWWSVTNEKTFQHKIHLHCYFKWMIKKTFEVFVVKVNKWLVADTWKIVFNHV